MIIRQLNVMLNIVVSLTLPLIFAFSKEVSQMKPST